MKNIRRKLKESKRLVEFTQTLKSEKITDTLEVEYGWDKHDGYYVEVVYRPTSDSPVWNRQSYRTYPDEESAKRAFMRKKSDLKRQYREAFSRSRHRKITEATSSKLTKAKIERMAMDIAKFLEDNGLNTDLAIYYNGDSIHYDSNGKATSKKDNPAKYFDYVPENHILSMSFEGPFYEVMNDGGKRNWDLQEKFYRLLKKYGVYSELGNSWNLSVYPIDDNMEVEYTKTSYTPRQTKNKQREYIHINSGAPYELQRIMDKWYQLSAQYGDRGSSVLGAGFEFDYEGQPYFMSACSPYQGSLSWESSKDKIEKMLKDIGAENIYYKWGNMD